MATTLCIDRGNSHVKLAVFNDSSIAAQYEGDDADVLNLTAKALEAHAPEAAIICSVVGNHPQLEALLQEKVKHVVKLDSDTRLPIMNAYSSPETLGMDRLAMAVAAQDKYPGTNVLAISLGTCITYNFVQKNKAFRGGAISPGLDMRLRSMHEFTHSLPQVSAEGEVVLLGYDTSTSMRSGAVYGMASEIEGMVAAFTAQYPDFNAVLTGGNLGMFEGKLKREIFADPHLLLKGLNLILHYNVPQLR